MKEVTANTPIGDIRRVVMYFVSKGSTEHFVHKDDVDAIVKLHVNHGVKPLVIQVSSKINGVPTITGVVLWSRTERLLTRR